MPSRRESGVACIPQNHENTISQQENLKNVEKLENNNHIFEAGLVEVLRYGEAKETRIGKGDNGEIIDVKIKSFDVSPVITNGNLASKQVKRKYLEKALGVENNGITGGFILLPTKPQYFTLSVEATKIKKESSFKPGPTSLGVVKSRFPFRHRV